MVKKQTQQESEWLQLPPSTSTDVFCSSSSFATPSFVLTSRFLRLVLSPPLLPEDRDILPSQHSQLPSNSRCSMFNVQCLQPTTTSLQVNPFLELLVFLGWRFWLVAPSFGRAKTELLTTFLDGGFMTYDLYIHVGRDIP